MTVATMAAELCFSVDTVKGWTRRLPAAPGAAACHELDLFAERVGYSFPPLCSFWGHVRETLRHLVGRHPK
jgi:hypothetical protein